MAALPPSICTELATQAYVIKKADRRGRFPLVTSMTLDNYFTFDLSTEEIKHHLVNSKKTSEEHYIFSICRWNN